RLFAALHLDLLSFPTRRSSDLYDFPSMPFFSRLVASGSRVRLFLRCPNSIYYEKNYNSGGDVANETGADARVAHVTVYHDAAHPDRKSTRLNSSHLGISYAVFC